MHVVHIIDFGDGFGSHTLGSSQSRRGPSFVVQIAPITAKIGLLLAATSLLKQTHLRELTEFGRSTWTGPTDNRI